MKRTATALALVPLTLLAGLAQAGEETLRLKDAPGRDLTTGRCVVCHSLDYIQMNAVVMDRAGWNKTIHKMIEKFGAPVSETEAQEILEYLAKNYSP